jgi:hypothetical protein
MYNIVTLLNERSSRVKTVVKTGFSYITNTSQELGVSVLH